MATFNDMVFKNTFEGMRNTTYTNLVTLVSQSKLIPGKCYRIIDYVTTTVQSDIGITISNSALNNVFGTAMTSCVNDIIFNMDNQYYDLLENVYINNDLYKYCNSTEVETYRQDIINSIRS